MNVTLEEWMKINQDYLIAEINVIKAKLLAYKDSLSAETKSDEPALLQEKAMSELEKIKKELTIKPRLASLIEFFQLSPFEKEILLTGIGVELDADFGKLIAKISGSSGHQMPTLSLV